MEYGHDRAVADGVNVGYDVYRINTKITGGGSKVEAGFYVDKRDKLSRKVRWEQLADDLEYEARALDRSVVAKDQIRTVIRTFRDKLFTEIFPGRKKFLKPWFLLRMTAMLRTLLRLFVKNLAKEMISARKLLTAPIARTH